MPGAKSYEDDLMDQVGSDTGDTFEEHNAGDEGGDPSVTVDKTPGTQQQPNARTDDNAGTQNGQQPTTPVAQPGVQPQRRTDAQGNLLDDKGNIIAQKGGERRYVETLQKRHRDLETQVSGLQKQLQESTALGGVPARLGLDNEDVNLALQIAHEFKSNPVQAARNVVEKALALGHDLNEILGSGASALDVQGIKALIKSELNPITSKYAQESQVTASQEAGIQAYHKFVADYPIALVHEDALAYLMNQGASPEAALITLRDYADERGLDFKQPLKPQLEARAASGNGNQNPQVPQVPAVPRGMPQGGNPQSFAGQQEIPASRGDASWDSIVSDAMREAGIVR